MAYDRNSPIIGFRLVKQNSNTIKERECRIEETHFILEREDEHGNNMQFVYTRTVSHPGNNSGYSSIVSVSTNLARIY